MADHQRAILLLAHGTIRDVSEMPEFLSTIRRGRPPSQELIDEMVHRYTAIGGSPLLEITEQQARAVSDLSGIPARVAMRLSEPRVERVVPALLGQGVRSLCLLPLAPHSVHVYVAAARAAISGLGEQARRLEVVAAEPWGCHPTYVAAQAELIARHLTRAAGEVVVLTAHSLPTRVIASGDGYSTQVAAHAEAVTRALGIETMLAYQSQGADGGDWLGPSLEQTLAELAQRGTRRVVVAPVGFLADHVETLYDLDIEAKQLARDAGLDWVRVPALNVEPGFITALVEVAQRAFEHGAFEQEASTP